MRRTGSDVGSVAEAHRDDVRDRPRLPADRLGDRDAGLAEGEVERGALVRPLPVLAVVLARRAGRPEVQRLEQPRERLDRVLARERELGARLLEGELVVPVVRDVLADALVPLAAEADDRRPPDEAARHLLVEPVEGVVLEDERDVAEQIVGRHGGDLALSHPCRVCPTSPGVRPTGRRDRETTRKCRRFLDEHDRAVDRGQRPG